MPYYIRMANGFDSFFGPLSKKYCYYFYILSLIGFLLATFLAFFGLIVGVTKRKGITFYVALATSIITPALFYLQNRLLYNMCSHSI